MLYRDLYQDLFELGDNFHTYVERGSASERQAVAQVASQLETTCALPPSTIASLTALDARHHLLVAGEMWCPDCQINITALHKMCELQPQLQLSVISKGRAEDSLLNELALESIDIPVVVILDQDFNPVGRFIERPGPVAADPTNEAIKARYAAGDFLNNTVCEVLSHIK